MIHHFKPFPNISTDLADHFHPTFYKYEDAYFVLIRANKLMYNDNISRICKQKFILNKMFSFHSFST
jgi:hypothetical protein